MRKEQKKKVNNRLRRKYRTSLRIAGHNQLPRLAIYKSLKHIYAQIIDDQAGKTICAARDEEIKEKKEKPLEIAKKVGELIAKKAAEKKVSEVKFDRSFYKYHGLIKALAEGAREGGLKF